jgi:hypothetical protein
MLRRQPGTPLHSQASHHALVSVQGTKDWHVPKPATFSAPVVGHWSANFSAYGVARLAPGAG